MAAELPPEISDSLEKLERTNGAEKIDLLISLARYYLYKDSKLATKYSESSKELSHELEDDARLAESILLLGRSCYNSSDILTSMEYFSESKTLFERLGDVKGVIETLLITATAQNILGDHSRALLSNFNALKLSKDINDIKQESIALIQIGQLYFRSEEYELALEYLHKSYELCLITKDKKILASLTGTIGGVYVELPDYEKAIEYFKKSQTIFEELNSSNNIASSYLNIGITLFKMGKNDEALQSINTGLETFIKLDRKEHICRSLAVISQIHSKEKNYDTALECIDKAVQIGEQYNLKQALEDIYVEKSNASAATGNYKNAYEFFIKYHELVNQRLKETSEINSKYLNTAHKVDTLKKESDTLTAKNSELNEMNEQLNLRNNNLNDSLTTLYSQSTEIKRVNNINTKLLSILAHDLKNPLSTIEQAAELYAEQAFSPEETQEIFKELKTNAHSTLGMLDEVLQWGTIQVNDKKTADFVDLNIYDLVQQKGVDYSLSLKSKNNRLENLCDKNFIFKADVNMLSFIVRNLIVNANKFTKNGIITVRTIDADEHITIIVSDTGIGMNPLQIQRLFNWQTRQSTDGTSGEKGTGLGLLICNEFVINHQGKIWVESTPGKGSSFHFTISKNLK